MSGRGLPGGGMVRHHEPKDVQVTLRLRTTISSSLISLTSSGSDASAVPDTFVQIYASIKHSTHPTLAVTLSTWRTPLERFISPGGDSSSPVWLHGALTHLQSTSNPHRYGGPPELGYRVHRRGGFARNLREDWDFITVPSLESGKEVVVEHRLPVEKLEFWKKRDDGYRDEVKPEEGETWAIGPSQGGLGTFWWTWGDLEEDFLKGKEFRNDEWFDGNDGNGETVMEGKGEGAEWVESEGENGFGLTMEIENEAEVVFV